MALLGVVLLVCAAGALLTAESLPGQGAAKVGGNRPINAGATNPADISANNSPMLVRNPTNPANLVVTNRVDSPTYSCALNISFDGGGQWQASPIPFPAGEPAPPRCYIPDPSFGPNGTLYLSFVTLAGLGNSPDAVWLVTSTNGGQSFSTPTKIGGPLNFQVHIAADPYVPNRIYMTWLHADETGTLLFPNVGNPIEFSVSNDNGATWSAPTQVNSPSRVRVVAPSIAIGPGDRLYISYLDLGNDALDYNGGSGGYGGPAYPGPWTLMLARSTDEGGQWAQTVVDAHIVPYTRFVVFLPPVPSLALDPHSGRIYLAFTDARLGEADVYVWSSAASHVAFGAGVRVDHTPAGDGTAKYLPALAIAPNGSVDVLYYSRQADPTNILNQAYLASSYDAGKSFEPSLDLSDRPFDSRVAPNSSANLPDLGSGLALLSTDSRALAVWTDTRAGTILSGKQDLAVEVVSINAGSPWRLPLLVVGIVLALAGVLAMVRTWLTMYRARSPVGEAAKAEVVP